MTLTIHNLDEAKEIIKKNNIVLFMKGTKDIPGCGFSAHVVQILNNLNVDYVDIDNVNILIDGKDITIKALITDNFLSIPRLDLSPGNHKISINVRFKIVK